MIKSQVTLKQLEAFAFVVDTGTFRAAAVALGTTQPNISSRIATLEAALGVTLLYRDPGSVRLTAKGHALLDKTRKILRAGEALLEEAGRLDLIDERLRLGVTELIACTWLQEFLRALKCEYSSLRVELQVDLSNRIEEHLLEGQIDLAFQNGPFKSELDGTTELRSEEYVWVANAALAAALPKGTSVERFFNFAVLTHAKHTSAGRALHALAQERGLDAEKIVHSNALSACIPMACEGLGVALLPRALVEAQVAAGELHVLEAGWHAAPLRFYARYQTGHVPRFVERASRIAQNLRMQT
ncbi:MAG: LysR family transcriptional regulator [Pseudomonadota bacterium]